MLGICEDLGAKEGNDMIRDYWDGFVAEVSVVDAQLGVKPVDFIRDEFSRDETLRMGFPQRLSMRNGSRGNRRCAPWTRPRPEPWPSVLLCL